jgi:titin
MNWFQLINTSVAPVPAAPSNLIAAAVSTSQINLSWVNNATNQTGFEIDRSSNGTSFSLLANVGAAVTTYSDMGLSASTTYFYRV